MKNSILKGKTALVTGASGGLGADFARELAANGADLILVARRRNQLETIAHEIMAQYGVTTHCIDLDLSLPESPESLYQQVQRVGRPVDVLVNNAGFGLFGNFSAIGAEEENQMLQLDIVALTRLTRLFLNGMLARNWGYILLVASVAAYQPTPGYAAYSAAKSYVLNLGEALNYELRHSGVGVTVISPGVTATSFFENAGQSSLSFYQRLAMMESRKVARIGVVNMLRRRPCVIPGFLNQLLAFSTRFAPRRLQAVVSSLLLPPPSSAGQSG